MAGANDSVVAVSDATFDGEVLKSTVPVLVDFWAPWCGPCRAVAPIVGELSTEYSGRAKMVKLNTDESQATAAKYRIRSIPTLIMFKGGVPVEQIVGAVPKARLKAMVDKAL